VGFHATFKLIERCGFTQRRKGRKDAKDGKKGGKWNGGGVCYRIRREKTPFRSGKSSLIYNICELGFVKKRMDENSIANIVVDLCYKIHSRYGPGLMESVYEEILYYELENLGLYVERQKSIPLIHENLIIHVAFRADLIVEKCV
jgi:hypothetical protein